MKKYSVQLAALVILCAISFCSAGEEKKEEKKEKKCPPEGVELKPIELSSEDLEHIIHHWRLVKHNNNLYGRDLSCSEYTYGKSEKGVFFHGSSYNESSNKVWATTATFSQKGKGVYEGVFEDKRADGEYYFLYVNKKMYILAGCINDKEFALWVKTVDGKLDKEQEEIVEATLKKNGLPNDLKQASNDNCAKKKSSI